MTGIDLLKLTSESRPHMVRILLTGYTDVGALVEAINCGLVYMYITKPWKNDDLKLQVAVEHYESNKKHHALKVANERLGLRLKEMKLGFVSALAEALRAKDAYACEHAYRTSDYAAEIAARMESAKKIEKTCRLRLSCTTLGTLEYRISCCERPELLHLSRPRSFNRILNEARAFWQPSLN